ncbi:MAG: DUF4391 domain-containing protein [Tetragenococcus koreensis]|uniref:DUF4391 domain-containing protein n=1 Tax=Alkalibacterium gilvum TaxID=1130080 RepID=UPI00264A5CA7|nr:DUF4391 domain-containing protein [Tetragenococcus koreensis]
MNEKEVLNDLGFPAETRVLRTFPYNKIEPLLTTKQKRLFNDTVVSRSIRILASINSINSNIPKYEDEDVRYEEIHFFTIQVKRHRYNTQFYKIFQKLMPYPLIILFYDEDGKEIMMADTIKVDNGSLSVYKLYKSNRELSCEKYLRALHFSKQETIHLYGFYTSLIQSLVNAELKERYHTESDDVLRENRLEKIKEIEKEIDGLVNKAKKESQLNKRIELQLQVNQLKETKEKLIKGE